MTAFVIWRQPRTATEIQASYVPQQIEHAPSVDAAEVETLREQTKDLAKLRNEVRQLRIKKSELDAARRENANLIQAKQMGTPVPRTTPPGFVAKEQLANMGFATPDDAIQTFFWAIREGNLRMMIESISPADPERQRFDKMSPEQIAKQEQKAARGMDKSDDLKGFREFGIRARELVSDDAMILHVGSSFTTNTMKFQMERTSEGWKLRKPFSP